jgi:hypothetical protein
MFDSEKLVKWDDLKEVVIEHFSILFFVFSQNWGLNSGLCVRQAVTLPLELHLQFILLWLFWRWGLANYLPSLASNLPISASQVARITAISTWGLFFKIEGDRIEYPTLGSN